MKIRYAYYFTHIISCPNQFSEGKSAGCKQSYQGLKTKVRDIIAYFHVSRLDLTWWWRHVTWQWRQCSPLSRRGDRTRNWRELQSEILYCASSMLIYCGRRYVVASQLSSERLHFTTQPTILGSQGLHFGGQGDESPPSSQLGGSLNPIKCLNKWSESG